MATTNFNVEETLKPMSVGECKSMYDGWCDRYEMDMPNCQYEAYKGAAKCFVELNLPKDSKILDCGAGTGLLGQELIANGYTNLDCLDGSAKMLEVAKKKNIYKTMHVSYVEPDRLLPIDEASYDILVMVGVFCPGHFPLHVNTFKQLIRLLKKGGTMAWGMANPERYADRDDSYANQGFQKIIQSLADDGTVKMLEGYPKTFPNYLKGEDGFFYAVRKL